MIAYQVPFAFSKRIALVAVLASACLSKLGAADARLWVPAKVNGQPVRLALDTGSEATVLCREAAERLGLRVTNAPSTVKLSPGETVLATAETCDLTVWAQTFKAALGVLDVPRGMSGTIDGFVGWPSMRSNIIRFDATTLEVLFGPKSLPETLTNWLTCGVRTNMDILVMEIAGPAGEAVDLSIDTGSDTGISLSSKAWQEWISIHPRRRKTLEASFMPGSGLLVRELTWSDKITLGNLTLTGTQIREANATEIAMGGPRFGANLGLAALKRMDLIVDAPRGVAYVRPVTTPPFPFDHNRIGAVFVPADVERDEALIAHVLDGSPASEAGIRNGDILQKIDRLDVTTWRTNPAVMPLSRFFEQAPGTKIALTLKRGEKILHAEVVLRDLIGPKRIISQQPPP